MSTPTGFPAVWGSGYWDNNVWEQGPPPEPEPPDDSTYEDTSATHSIEFSLMLRLDQEIPWDPPPPQVYPLRNFRAVMNDYRVTNGIPVTPPTLDCAVPVMVAVDPKGVAVESTKRAEPADIKTGATLRWYADGQFINQSVSMMQWWDSTGKVAWESYDDWQPLYDSDYTYQIPKPNNAEIVMRPTLIFDSSLGSNMATSLSINPVNNEPDVEFYFVLWVHPMLVGQQYSAILDNGQGVHGFHDLPWRVNDSLNGQHQALHRYPDKAVLWQDDLGLPLYWTQVSGSGRPVLYRVRFGMHPLVESWGPTNTTMKYSGANQVREALCSDYVLGRVFGRLDTASNGGMHLFEVDYFDHALSDTDAATVVAALNACYAISA